MTYKEVKEMVSGCGLNITSEFHEECMEKVITALEKQIPKKPIRDLRKGIECYCPICNSYVGYYGNDNTQNNYCSDCGQALDWSEENE